MSRHSFYGPTDAPRQPGAGGTIRSMNKWVGPVAKIGAVLLVIVMLCARGLVKAFSDSEIYPHDLLDRKAYVTIGLAALAAVATLLSLFSRARWLTVVGVVAAVLALPFVGLHAFTASGEGGGLYPPLLAGLVLAIFSLGISPTDDPTPSEIGDLVDGKRHGEWLIYHPDGKLAETRHYDHGNLVETRPYVPK